MRKRKFVYQNVVVDDLGTKDFFFICKSAFLPVMKIKAWDVFFGAYGSPRILKESWRAIMIVCGVRLFVRLFVVCLFVCLFVTLFVPS